MKQDFPRANYSRPNQALPVAKNCYQHYLIKELIKKLFTVHCDLSLSSFPLQLIQSLLIGVITFPNRYKRNALARNELVRT